MALSQLPVDIAAVVITYNSADVLPGLLRSLPDGLTGVTWRLVVVDNDSQDESAELARRLRPDCTLVRTGRNAGYAAGLNAGVAEAGPHTAVLVLNPDVRLTSGAAPVLLQALSRPGVGIAVPRLMDADGELHFSLRREPTVLRAFGDALLGATRAGRWPALGEIVTDPSCYENSRLVDWAEGSTQLISAECWNAVGAWDESFFLYSEEAEFGLRARDRGWATSYVPDAHATHLQGESRTSPGLWALLVANRVRLHRRRRGPVAGTLFWAAMVLREASRALLGQDVSRAALKTLTNRRRMRERPGPDTVRSV